jgi:transcription elongation factor Elf1
MFNNGEGSMVGSGIYSVEFENDHECGSCGETSLMLFSTDDNKMVAWADCPKCEAENEIDVQEKFAEPEDDEIYDDYGYQG